MRSKEMKRFLLFGTIIAFLISACAGLASPKNTVLSDKYGVVTVFTAPT
jgi:hypothetical protein